MPIDIVVVILPMHAFACVHCCFFATRITTVTVTVTVIAKVTFAVTVTVTASATDAAAAAAATATVPGAGVVVAGYVVIVKNSYHFPTVHQPFGCGECYKTADPKDPNQLLARNSKSLRKQDIPQMSIERHTASNWFTEYVQPFSHKP